MLLLLRDVLRKVQQSDGLPVLPMPCEYFDIIAGSGTGGLIALLLGRLRMSVEDAIECYARVVAHVFTQIKADGSFRATPFEKVLREISYRFGDGGETAISDPHPFPCKTFVCAREVNGSGNVKMSKLRTYAISTEPAPHITLLQAARATMGNPTFFKPMSVSNGVNSSTLLDAGDDYYNPVFALFDEALSIYPSRHIGYLLSIGPGTAVTVGENPSHWFANRPKLPPSVISALCHLADCCDRTASAFEKQHGQYCDERYFRLTPSRPAPDGRILWEQEEELKEFIAPYLATIRGQLEFLVVAIMNEQALVTPRHRR